MSSVREKGVIFLESLERRQPPGLIWNQVFAELRSALRPHGAPARLIPVGSSLRVSDYGTVAKIKSTELLANVMY